MDQSTSEFIVRFWDQRSSTMMCHERASFRSVTECAQAIWDGAFDCDQVIEFDLGKSVCADASKIVAETLYEWWRDAPRYSRSSTAADFINEHTIYGVEA